MDFLEKKPTEFFTLVEEKLVKYSLHVNIQKKVILLAFITTFKKEEKNRFQTHFFKHDFIFDFVISYMSYY